MFTLKFCLSEMFYETSPKIFLRSSWWIIHFQSGIDLGPQALSSFVNPLLSERLFWSLYIAFQLYLRTEWCILQFTSVFFYYRRRQIHLLYSVWKYPSLPLVNLSPFHISAWFEVTVLLTFLQLHTVFLFLQLFIIFFPQSSKSWPLKVLLAFTIGFHKAFPTSTWCQCQCHRLYVFIMDSEFAIVKYCI